MDDKRLSLLRSIGADDHIANHDTIAELVAEIDLLKEEFRIYKDITGNTVTSYDERIARLTVEIDSLRKEYDEEVISHDLEEKDLRKRLQEANQIAHISEVNANELAVELNTVKAALKAAESRADSLSDEVTRWRGER